MGYLTDEGRNMWRWMNQKRHFYAKNKHRLVPVQRGILKKAAFDVNREVEISLKRKRSGHKPYWRYDEHGRYYSWQRC